MSGRITPSSLFVVSGGGRGITAACVIGLAQQYGCRFLLLGRTSLREPEPIWAAGCRDRQELRDRAAGHHRTKDGRRPTPIEIERMLDHIVAAREITATLEAVRRAGGQAEYASVDIGDQSALLRELGAALDGHGDVTGLIHGAGVLADKPMSRQTPADFEAVFAPKVHGLAHLLACLPPEQLKYLILFSSAAAFYGNPGQANYAIANEVLNKAAFQLQSQYPACRVLAIDWGPWDGGMVTPERKKLFVDRGVPLLDREAGVSTFLALMSADHETPQVVTGTGRLGPLVPAPSPAAGSYRIHRHLTLDASPFLRDHVIGSHPVLPAVCAGAWIAHACEELFPGYHPFCCEDLTVLKGIVFDGDLASEHILGLERETQDRDQLVCQARIWSSTPPGGVRYHYSTRVTLLRQIPDPPLAEPVSLRPLGVPGNLPALYGDHGLFHGPAFQGIRRVLHLDGTGLTLECNLAPIPRRDQGQFPVRSLNPFISDVQLQGLIIWALLVKDTMSLPTRAGRTEYYRPITFGQTFYVSLAVRQTDDYRTIADITAQDEEGRVYARFLGSEAVPTPSLNRRRVLAAPS